MQATESHHRLMARREMMGLARVGEGDPNVGQNYAALNNASGFTLNLLQGMAYGETSSNACYNVVEDFIVSLDTVSDIFRKLYIPAWWAEAQVQF